MKKKNVYIYIIYVYKVEKFFFFSEKLEKKDIKKINFINLFGLEVKKILFLGFTKCKTEENKNFRNLFGYYGK